jgi:uncharacterized protein YdhG (YjbR/CyaY superfamily)
MPIVDDYLDTLDGPRRAAVGHIYQLVLAAVPDVTQERSYGMPAFKYKGKPLISCIAAKDHLSLFPFSASVVDAVKSELDGYDTSKGTIRFSEAKPLPDALINKIILLRIQEIAGGSEY